MVRLEYLNVAREGKVEAVGVGDRTRYPRGARVGKVDYLHGRAPAGRHHGVRPAAGLKGPYAVRGDKHDLVVPVLYARHVRGAVKRRRRRRRVWADDPDLGGAGRVAQAVERPCSDGVVAGPEHDQDVPQAGPPVGGRAAPQRAVDEHLYEHARLGRSPNYMRARRRGLAVRVEYGRNGGRNRVKDHGCRRRVEGCRAVGIRGTGGDLAAALVQVHGGAPVAARRVGRRSGRPRAVDVDPDGVARPGRPLDHLRCVGRRGGRREDHGSGGPCAGWAGRPLRLRPVYCNARRVRERAGRARDGQCQRGGVIGNVRYRRPRAACQRQGVRAAVRQVRGHLAPTHGIRKV